MWVTKSQSIKDHNSRSSGKHSHGTKSLVYKNTNIDQAKQSLYTWGTTSQLLTWHNITPKAEQSLYTWETTSQLVMSNDFTPSEKNTSHRTNHEYKRNIILD